MTREEIRSNIQLQVANLVISQLTESLVDLQIKLNEKDIPPSPKSKSKKDSHPPAQSDGSSQDKN